MLSQRAANQNMHSMCHSTEASIYFLPPVAYLQLDTGLVKIQTRQLPGFFSSFFFCCSLCFSPISSSPAIERQFSPPWCNCFTKTSGIRLWIYFGLWDRENALYPTHIENKVDDPPLHVVHSPLIPKNPPMPLLQLRLVWQRQRHKTVEWKKKLASRLHFMDATLNMCRCLLDVISLSFAFVSPILALAISAIPEFVSRTPHLQPIRVFAALLGMALQLSVLCGAIGREPVLSFILDPVWHCKQKPSLTLQLQPDMSLVGMCTGHCRHQAIHGPSLCSAQHPGPFIWVCTCVLIDTHLSLWNHFAGLDPEVTVRDVMADLHHCCLIPELSHVDHYLTFPSCRYHDGHLQPHESLVDLGVVDISTYLYCTQDGLSNSIHHDGWQLVVSISCTIGVPELSPQYMVEYLSSLAWLLIITSSKLCHPTFWLSFISTLAHATYI